MLTRGTTDSHELKIGKTTYLVESESPTDAKGDMIDWLVKVMIRDMAKISKIGISDDNIEGADIVSESEKMSEKLENE